MSDIVFTLVDVIQLGVFIVAVAGGWFTMRAQITAMKSEVRSMDAYKKLVQEQQNRLTHLETYHEVHKESFGKIERMLDRIERKLDGEADKVGNGDT